MCNGVLDCGDNSADVFKPLTGSCSAWQLAKSFSKSNFDFPRQFFRQGVAVLARNLNDIDIASTLDLVCKPVASFGDRCEEICRLGEEFDNSV